MAGRLIATETGVWILSSYGFSVKICMTPSLFTFENQAHEPASLQCSVHPFSIWLGVSSLYSHSISRNPRQMEGVLRWLHVLRGPLSGFPLKQGSLGSKGLALPSRPVSGQTIRNPAVKAPSLFLRLV